MNAKTIIISLILKFYLLLSTCTSTSMAINYENLYEVHVNLYMNTIDIGLINSTFTNINCTSEPIELTSASSNTQVMISYSNRTSCQLKFDKRFVKPLFLSFVFSWIIRQTSFLISK
jgi:hypothetical protein